MRRILHRSSYISTKHEGATRAHPDNWKIKAKIFFRTSRGLITTTHLSTGSDQLLGPGITQVLATPLSFILIWSQYRGIQCATNTFHQRLYCTRLSMHQSIELCKTHTDVVRSMSCRMLKRELYINHKCYEGKMALQISAVGVVQCQIHAQLGSSSWRKQGSLYIFKYGLCTGHLRPINCSQAPPIMRCCFSITCKEKFQMTKGY